mgnify:CR=1 FL=1
MAEITAKLVKELREKSGAGVMDAKKALVETDGDIEKAIELLREKGMAKAAKKLTLINISEPTRLLSPSYAVFCLKKKNTKKEQKIMMWWR